MQYTTAAPGAPPTPMAAAGAQGQAAPSWTDRLKASSDEFSGRLAGMAGQPPGQPGLNAGQFSTDMATLKTNLAALRQRFMAGPPGANGVQAPAETATQRDERGGQGDDGTDPTTAAGKAAQQSSELAAFDKSATAAPTPAAPIQAPASQGGT